MAVSTFSRALLDIPEAFRLSEDFNNASIPSISHDSAAAIGLGHTYPENALPSKGSKRKLDSRSDDDLDDSRCAKRKKLDSSACDSALLPSMNDPSLEGVIIAMDNEMWGVFDMPRTSNSPPQQHAPYIEDFMTVTEEIIDPEYEQPLNSGSDPDEWVKLAGGEDEMSNDDEESLDDADSNVGSEDKEEIEIGEALIAGDPISSEPKRDSVSLWQDACRRRIELIFSEYTKEKVYAAENFQAEVNSLLGSIHPQSHGDFEKKQVEDAIWLGDSLFDTPFWDDYVPQPSPTEPLPSWTPDQGDEGFQFSDGSQDMYMVSIPGHPMTNAARPEVEQIPAFSSPTPRAVSPEPYIPLDFPRLSDFPAFGLTSDEPMIARGTPHAVKETARGTIPWIAVCHDLHRCLRRWEPEAENE